MGSESAILLRDQGLICTTLGRRGGLVVSALDFRSGDRWFEPGLCRRVVS